MAEKIKADSYIAYLERILAGEKDIGPIEDIEIEQLLMLAKTMIAADLSVNMKIRENLRKQLLASIKRSNLDVLSSKDYELDEEALEHITAAGQQAEQKDICPYCGSRAINFDGKCRFCNH